MTEATRVELTVLGEKLALRTAESPEYLQSLVRFLEERVASLGLASRPPMTAVVMAALDMADELLRTRDERSRTEGAVGARLRTLVQTLERAAPPE